MNEITINSSWASLDCLRDIIAIFPVCQLRPFMPVYFPVFGLSSHPCNWCPSSYSTFVGLYVFIIHPLNRSRIYHFYIFLPHLHWWWINVSIMNQLQLQKSWGNPIGFVGRWPVTIRVNLGWTQLQGAKSCWPLSYVSLPLVTPGGREFDSSLDSKGRQNQSLQKVTGCWFQTCWIIFHNSIPYMGCHPSPLTFTPWFFQDDKNL